MISNVFEKTCFPASPLPQNRESQGSTQGSTQVNYREALSPSLERETGKRGSMLSQNSMVDSLSAQMTFIVNDVGLMSRAQFGQAGESYAYATFERAGYSVARVGRGDQRGDLRVVDMDTGIVYRVEVKAARRDAQGRWQVCLKRQIKARVCTDAAHSDFVLLLAFPRVGSPVPFLIPVDHLQGMKQIALTSDPKTYTGKWSKYRVLDGLKMPAMQGEDS